MNKLKSMYHWRKGDNLAILINALGTTPLMEQYIFANHIRRLCELEGSQVTFVKVGTLLTSLDMKDVSLNLLKVEDLEWVISDKTIIGYQSLNGITHQLQKINNEHLYVESKTLLQLTIKEDHLQNKKYGSISTDLINNIEKLITLPSQESIKILTAHDFDIKSAEEFIQDLKTTKNIYSVIKLETKDNKEITSDNGFFIIETKGKQWLFSQDEQNDGTLSLTNLNDILFEQKINQLLNNR